MKTIAFICLAGCLGLAACASLSDSAKAEGRGQTARKVDEQVENRHFKIVPSTAMPLGGRNVSLSAYFSLEIRNDSIFSHLPYYGRGYMLPYGGGAGLNFEAPITQYEQRRGKKDSYEIKVEARTDEDYYTYHMTIYPNGSASIGVNMQNRQSIDFLGDLELEPRK